MTRQIPVDGPLSDEDRAYLHMRGDSAKVEWFDQTYPPGEVGDTAEDDEEGDDYDSWTVHELNVEIDRLNEDGAEIAPESTRKADLITALRAYSASLEEE